MSTVTEQTLSIIDTFVTAVLDGKLEMFDEKVNMFFHHAQNVQFERKTGTVDAGKAEMLAELIEVTFSL